MVNTGPPSPIPIEYPNDDRNGQWKIGEDFDVGCPPGKAGGVLRKASSDVVDACKKVGIPWHDSVLDFLQTVLEILQASVGGRNIA